MANDDKDSPGYLAVYDFAKKEDLDAFVNSPEVAAARDERKQSWPDLTHAAINWTAHYEKLDSFTK